MKITNLQVFGILASSFIGAGSTALAQGETRVHTENGNGSFSASISETVLTDENLVGVQIAPTTTLSGIAAGSITLNADADTSFASMTGVSMNQSTIDDVAGLTDAERDALRGHINVSSLNIALNTAGGGTGTAGSITGFTYTGSKTQISSAFRLNVDINAQAAQADGSSIVGIDMGDARITAIANTVIQSTINIDATGLNDGITTATDINTIAAPNPTAPPEHTSADSIVGFRLSSAETISGNTVRILANSGASGTVTGIALTGAGKLAVDGIAFPDATNGDTHDATVVHIYNTGGSSTGIDILNTVSDSFNATVVMSGVNSTGISVEDSKITELNGRIDIKDDSVEAVGIRLNGRMDGEENIACLKSTIRIDNHYDASDNRSALLKTNIDDFGVFSSADNVFHGTNSGTGMDITADFTGNRSVESSGTINAEVAVVTDAAYITTAEGDTFLGVYAANEEGEIALTNAPAEATYSKSNVAIDITSQLDAGDSQDKTVELNFGTAAKILSYVGGDAFSPEFSAGNPFDDDNHLTVQLPYGDVINYDTAKLEINSRDTSGDTCSIGALDRGATLFVGDISYSGPRNNPTELQFRTGTFDVHSKHWQASTVSFGDAADSVISRVNLHDSTTLEGVKELNFHVNSVTEHSILAVTDGEAVNISDVTNINFTLTTDYLEANPTASVTLIDGEILDLLGGRITFNLDILDGTGNTGDYYITYGGTSYQYTDNLTIDLNGGSTDLILGVRDGNGGDGLIPEPSTATLSMLALAGLMIRRRRRRATS